MATSELNHYVRYDPTLLNDEDGVDTGMSRRAVGNINHIADQYAQVRVSVPPGVVHVADPSIDPQVADTPYRLFTSVPFDLHVRANGMSYKCRVRVRVSSNHATHTATFHVMLAGVDDSFSEHFESGDNLVTTQSTSTSYERKTLGPIWMDRDRVARAQRIVSTIDSFGGESRSAVWLRAQLVIYGEVVDTAAEARVSGVELHEYITP